MRTANIHGYAIAFSPSESDKARGETRAQASTLSSFARNATHGLIGSITLMGFPQDFTPDSRPYLLRELKFAAGGCARLLESQRLADADGTGD